MHIPVLLKEVVEVLNPKPGEFFIDGTIGSGGHSAAILERISSGGVLLGIDWDKKAIEMMREKIAANSKICPVVKRSFYYGVKNPRSNPAESGMLRGRQNSKLILVHGNYADLPGILKKYKLPKADGLLLDLGMSSEHLEKSGRGFTFQKDEPLIMRYQFQDVGRPGRPTSQILTAAEVVNTFSEKDLANIFYKYGEERYSRRIAKKIVEERKKKPIKTTFELVEIINKFYMNYKTRRTYKIHPATRVFQALRIYVNDELGNLEKLLKNLAEILKPGGRAAIISFHSLEDRLVKNHFRRLAKEGKVGILTKKPIKPTLEEIKQNPRSRSAKMRAIRYISH
jgi:16S rRNA (cytosine1402-N4)-methyltransferase